MPRIYFDEELDQENHRIGNAVSVDQWLGLAITDSSEYQMLTKKNQIFEFSISKHCEGWQFRVMDYIQYQFLNNRNVIIKSTKSDFEEAEKTYQGHSMFDRYLRSYEPKVLVHSTTPHAYIRIKTDNMLKSWNTLKINNLIDEEKPIGSFLGDPSDFSDYVMLGGMSFYSEIVVSSKEKNCICMDSDCEYTPGARFYFDTQQLVSQGLLVRDGCHYKVKDSLSINLSLFCATPENIELNDEKITPKTFAKAADIAFKKHLNLD